MNNFICIAPFMQKNVAQIALQQKKLHVLISLLQERHKINIKT